MIEMMAVHWYTAEKIANTEHGALWPKWAELPIGRRDIILKRVKDVLDGEVRRSECGPGDLAIWHGRFRTAPKYVPFSMPQAAEDFSGEATKRLRGIRSVLYYNFFDSLDIQRPDFGRLETRVSTRLFNNNNVGDLSRCNLQVGSQMPGDATWRNQFWYAETQMYPDMTDIMEYVFSKAVVTCCVNDRPVQQKRLVELIRWPQPLDFMMPPRSNYSMNVDFFGDSLKAMFEAMKKRDPEREMRLFLHLEGWLNRDVS